MFRRLRSFRNHLCMTCLFRLTRMILIYPPLCGIKINKTKSPSGLFLISERLLVCLFTDPPLYVMVINELLKYEISLKVSFYFFPVRPELVEGFTERLKNMNFRICVIVWTVRIDPSTGSGRTEKEKIHGFFRDEFCLFYITVEDYYAEEK